MVHTPKTTSTVTISSVRAGARTAIWYAIQQERKIRPMAMPWIIAKIVLIIRTSPNANEHTDRYGFGTRINRIFRHDLPTIPRLCFVLPQRA